MDLVEFFILFSAACVFICHFFIDLEHRILPDALNIYLGLIFLLHGLLFSTWQSWLLGFLIGGGFPLLVSWGFYLYAKKEGLGLGDVKLFAVLGLILGPFGIVMNIFLSCFVGSVVGVSLLASKRIARDYPIPFGPFILLAVTTR
jgi:leader peptidase (prepilin peptidase)/N-methyltransferase